MSNQEIPDKREVRSFLVSRDPSVDRRYRPRPKRQVALFREVDEDYNGDESEESSSSTISNKTQQDGALIYLRMRPLAQSSTRYRVSENQLITTDNSTIRNKNQVEKHFTFSEIFNSDINQATLFDKCVRNSIEAEENFTILTYGTSYSGKTHTLLGDVEQPGIIPRAIENIFSLYQSNIFPQPAAKPVNGIATICDDERMRKETLLRKTLMSSCKDFQHMYTFVEQQIASEHNFETKVLDNTSVFIWVSFAEIYNEFVYDLLSTIDPTGTTKRKNHKIIANDGTVFIKDLVSVHVQQAVDAYKLLLYGQQKAQYAATAVNSNSSRSHCIFFIDIVKFSNPDLFTVISHKFCDLAGSERLGKTQNSGNRLKEAQRINTSLMVLGRCLDAANNNQKKKNADVVPYRESKLTMLLQAALQGKEKMCMVVNIAPSDEFYEENMNVLGFASIAKNIVFKPPAKKASRIARYSWFLSHAAQDKSFVQDNSQVEELLDRNLELSNENERLNNEVTELKQELVEMEARIRNLLVNKFQEILNNTNRQHEARLAKEVEMVKQSYERKLSSLRAELTRRSDDLI